MEIVHYGGAGYETPDTPGCSRHKLLDDDCNPYDEPQPFVRGRIDRNGYRTGYSSIDRDNSLLHRKLTEIQTRITSYAARDGPGTPQRPQLSEQSFVHNTAHAASRGKSPQKARAQEVATCNAMMAKKLSQLYAVRKDSFVVQNHLGKGIDCNERWQQRTSLYSSSCCSGAAVRSSGSGSRPYTAPAAGSRNSGTRGSGSTSACGSTAAGSGSSTGVPKTLGVALCAGCGCRSFFNADGAQLQPCPGCGHAFYCGNACREFDYPSHKAECRFHSTGRWHAAGIRPSEDCWVMNRAMAAARHLLQQQQRRGQPNSSSSRPGTAHAVDAHSRNVLGACSSQRRCKSAQRGGRSQVQQEACQACNGDLLAQSDWQQQLQQQLEFVRLQEQQEVLAQQQVELRASQGLDGPRPCLCSNGLQQLGGQRLRNPSAAAAAAQIRSTSDSAAGGGASSRRAGGRTWRGGKAWKGVHEA